MNKAFPDAEVNGFSSLIKNLSLPDLHDRHVLAAAIRSHADVIVTFNLKDFPVERLRDFDIEPVHPDKFLMNLIELDEEKAFKEFTNQISQLNNPPKSAQDVLGILQKNNLVQAAEYLKGLHQKFQRG